MGSTIIKCDIIAIKKTEADILIFQVEHDNFVESVIEQLDQLYAEYKVKIPTLVIGPNNIVRAFKNSD